jgi:hypothetical protein
MHPSLRHLASLLIILYLCIPVMGFSHAAVVDVAATEVGSLDAATGSPCGHCPCSDEQGSVSCDTGCCSCAFHSPPAQSAQPGYAPVVVVTRHDESFWMLPQVYLSIYVPPQNLFHAVSDHNKHENNLMPSAAV